MPVQELHATRTARTDTSLQLAPFPTLSAHVASAQTLAPLDPKLVRFPAARSALNVPLTMKRSTLSPVRSVVLVTLAAFALDACKQEQAPTPVPPSPTVRAQRLFSERCATCHGPQGRGDGPAGAALNPRPRNFADPSWHARATDEHLKKVIVEGGASVGLSPLMTANPDIGQDAPLRDAMVAYVRTLMTAH